MQQVLTSFLLLAAIAISTAQAKEYHLYYPEGNPIWMDLVIPGSAG